MGHMDVNRDMGWRLSRASVHHRSLQLFFHTLLAGHFAMHFFPVVIASLKGRQVNLGREIVRGDTKAAECQVLRIPPFPVFNEQTLFILRLAYSFC